MAPNDSLLSILPVQLVFKIISFLDDRKDLLSLALTCRVLTEVLIPDYIDHVEIHSPPHMTEIWDSLLKRPALCSYVKTLGLIHPMKEYLIIPPNPSKTEEFFWKANSNSWYDEQALILLYKVISKLENLTCFRTIFLSSIPADILSCLLEAIKVSHCILEKLEIEICHSAQFEGSIHVDRLSRGLSLFSPNLSSLSGLSLSIESCTDTETRCIIDTLVKAPCLMQLRLRIPVFEGRLAQVLRALFTLHWPMLKHLTIEQTSSLISTIGINSSYIATFLARHTNLETFYFEGEVAPGCFPTETSRCSLRSLHYISHKVGEAIPRLGDILPTSMAKHLVHISIGGAMNPELGIEENGLPSLETCHVLSSFEADSGFSFIAELTVAAPNLQKCSVRLKGNLSGRELISQSARLFKPLKNLTHLSGLLHATNVSEIWVDQVFDAFKDHPSLTYVNATTPQGKQWVRLCRSPGVPVSFEIIPLHRSYWVPDLNPNRWGGFFQKFRTARTARLPMFGI